LQGWFVLSQACLPRFQWHANCCDSPSKPDGGCKLFWLEEVDMNKWITTCLAFAALACGDDEPRDGVPEIECGTLTQADMEPASVTVSSGCWEVSDLLVKRGGLLVVEPGATFYFEAEAGLRLEFAALIAEGRADRPIRFSSRREVRASWSGIDLFASDDAENRLAHAEVRFAGQRGFGVRVGERSSLQVWDSTFLQNEGAALLVEEIDLPVVVRDTLFERNTVSIRVPANQVGGLGFGLTFTENLRGQIEVSEPGPALRGQPFQEIRTFQSWAAQGEPYSVLAPVRVLAPLILDAGVQIRSRGGFEVAGAGSLEALGVENLPVRFRGDELGQGGWFGIRVRNPDDDGAPEVRLQWTVVDGAGRVWPREDGRPSRASERLGALHAAGNADLVLRHVVFSNNAHVALDVSDLGLDDVTLEDIAFRENERPLAIGLQLLERLPEVLSFEGNDNEAVFLGSLGVDALAYEGGQPLTALSVPYRVAYGQVLQVTRELTVEPGVVFEFETGAGLWLNGGELQAEGTAAQPITFRAAEAGTRWKGIKLSGRFAANRLRHAVVEGAGREPWLPNNPDSRAAVLVRAARLAVDALRIPDSGHHGIALLFGGNLECEGPLEFGALPGDAIFADEFSGSNGCN
jgi:hypothetical protein